ncbi:ChbG/HpnK family deacetylase [Pelosinus fermentans]|uniref:YdjC family protein n=1 Tax=Pelosinus fermentans JBW45 TaxID=1192197 RepID=I9NS29_9FIRM|nr:ChbG/HpnK family deacetylase [Pelosinus fermentans]AJQ27712.1 YdjC family protein [Pelosinus fermentans JBW45]
MRQLIINADDFGINEMVNLGIIQGYVNGIITSTTIMPSGSAFDHAITLASVNKELGIGIHLTLVGETPLCDPQTIPSLVNNEGCLSLHYPEFFRRYCLGKIKLNDIHKELTAQVQKVMDSGIAVTHLDSHQHMHIVPGIIDVTIDIAKSFDIKKIRIPAEPFSFLGGYPFQTARIIARGGLTFLAEIARRKIQKQGFVAPEHFFGMLAGGNMHEEYLLRILTSLPEGTSEIMIHPGTNDSILQKMYNWNYHWQAELNSVTSSKISQHIIDHHIQLISFRELEHD